MLKSILGAVCACLVVVSFNTNAATIEFNDTNNPNHATAVNGIDLTSYGYGQYDVFFVSNRENITDGWSSLENAYSSVFSPDIYPLTSNSEELSHLIKREIVRNFNDTISMISGYSDPGASSYESHSAHGYVPGTQYILIPYRTGGNGVEGTFLRNNLESGWGSDDLTTNTFSNGVNSGTDRNYWAVITPSAVPVPAAVWLFGSGLIGLLGFARKKSHA